METDASNVSAPNADGGADYSTPVVAATPERAPLGLPARIEALLFVSAGPVPPAQLASALGVTTREVERGLDVLAAEGAVRGIRLQRHRTGVQLTTATESAGDVERLLNLESTARLTRAALEVLAITAYEQPVTRPQIDSVRGVNSDSALQTLLRHGLIEEAGRSEGPGRPILYATTAAFLQHFGLGSLSELPPLTPAPVPDVVAGANGEGQDVEGAA
jgi:segregation and condensation protein B